MFQIRVQDYILFCLVLVGSAVSFPQALSQGLSVRSRADEIYAIYQQQADAGSRSGFAYKSEAEKQRDLSAIDQQIRTAQAQGTNHTPLHQNHYKALKDARNRVAATPVNPSGGQGVWAGSDQQRMEAAMAFGSQTAEMLNDLNNYMKEVEERTRQQMLADTAKYGAIEARGRERLTGTANSALDALDALDASESGQGVGSSTGSKLVPVSDDAIRMAALERALNEVFDLLSKADPGNSSSLSREPPDLSDPAVLELLRERAKFNGLSPDELFPPGEDFSVLLGPDPRTQPWGKYTGDTICDSQPGVITGFGREAAIAEYDRKKALLAASRPVSEPPLTNSPQAVVGVPTTVAPVSLPPWQSNPNQSLLPPPKPTPQWKEPTPEYPFPPKIETNPVFDAITDGYATAKQRIKNRLDQMGKKISEQFELKQEYKDVLEFFRSDPTEEP